MASIVKGVDLTLRRGQIMGLIGESGAGNPHLALLQWDIPNQGVGSPEVKSCSTVSTLQN